MSYWIEIHCDIKNPGPDPTNPSRHRCYSNRNDNPGLMCSGVERGYRNLRQIALRDGWKQDKIGWICPGCQRIS